MVLGPSSQPIYTINMIKIENFKKEYAEKVSNLICDTLQEINSRDYSEAIINKMCAHFSPKTIIDLASRRAIFVAMEGANIVGTASLDGDVILSVFVDASLQGKGIGTKLMRYIEDTARKSGYRTLKLPSSVTSVNFYKKLGYKKLEEKTGEFGINVIMKKDLQYPKGTSPS